MEKEMDFFAMFDPISVQPEPLNLADLELVLRDQPEREPLRLWRYELPDGADVGDVVVEYDLSLTIGCHGEVYFSQGYPVEELRIVHEGGRIRITDSSGAPAARCDQCNGLIRAGDMACPYCSWAQWATPEGFLARPLPAQ